MSKFKTLTSEIIHENPWWKYYHEKYTMPNGMEGDYYFGETVGSGCSMVVPVLDVGRLVLTRQHRYLRDRASIEFPCGGLGVGESPSETAQRELLEETGYKAEEIIKVGSFDGLNGVFKDTAHVFLAHGLTSTNMQKPDDSESIEIIYRRMDEFEALIRSGEIWDGQTLATWVLVRDRLRQSMGI